MSEDQEVVETLRGMGFYIGPSERYWRANGQLRRAQLRRSKADSEKLAAGAPGTLDVGIARGRGKTWNVYRVLAPPGGKMRYSRKQVTPFGTPLAAAAALLLHANDLDVLFKR